MSNKLSCLFNAFKDGSISKSVYIRRMHNIHRILWWYSNFLSGRNMRSIGISAEDVVFTTGDGVKMICSPVDKRAIPIEIINFLNHEPAQLEIMKKFLGPGSNVLDIGANIGWYSINLAKHIGNGRIIAFEPVGETFALLRRNLKLNNLRNVLVFNTGLSDKKGNFEFYYNPGLTGGTSLRKLSPENRKIIRCRVERLDDMEKELPSRIDFIKCDVEGAELFVLQGALKLIQRNKPVIFLEMLRKWSAKFGYHPNRIIELLKEHGYICYSANNGRLHKKSRITNATKETNFYFLNNKKHAGFLRKLAKA